MTTFHVFVAEDQVNRSRSCLAWCVPSVGPGFAEVTFTDMNGVDIVDAPDHWRLGAQVAVIRSAPPRAAEA